MRKTDVVIVGSGISGLTIADNLLRKNLSISITIVEKEDSIGGILNLDVDCCDDIILKGEKIKREKFIETLKSNINESQYVNVMTKTAVVSVKNKTLTILSQDSGLEEIKAKVIVFATGAVEKTQGVLNIPGFRPSGVLTAGTVQHGLYNLDKFDSSSNVIIYGLSPSSMAVMRSFKKIGKKITLVTEEYAQIPDDKKEYIDSDFQSYKIIDIIGKERIESVKIAYYDEKGHIDTNRIETLLCDILVLGCGYIPFNPLLRDIKVDMNRFTFGPVFNKSNYKTNKKCIFVAGDALYIHNSLGDIVQENMEICQTISSIFETSERQIKRKINSLLRGKNE